MAAFNHLTKIAAVAFFTIQTDTTHLPQTAHQP